MSTECLSVCSLSRKKSSGPESAASIRTKVFVWGLNDKDQLGGLKGSKVGVKGQHTWAPVEPLCHQFTLHLVRIKRSSDEGGTSLLSDKASC